MPTDYTSTLNLPATEFAMRAALPQREGEVFDKWINEELNKKLLDKNKDKPLFVFHDGPPYANGNIHTGHALNKSLKDFIVRYKNMSGFRTHYIHGWDTHGLPTEMVVMKTKKVNRREVGDLAYRKVCAEVAKNFIDIQKKDFQRLGCTGDWDNSYYTLMPEFEKNQIKIFGEMAKKGYIYKSLKPVYWCAHDETALAEAEIEYQDDKCDSIYVKFNITDDKKLFTKYTGSLEKVFMVIWTTTTWTLPGNVAISVGPSFEYSLVQANGEHYVIASELLKKVMETAKIVDYKVITKIKGSELEYVVTKHPFFERESLVIVGDHVSLESGTGCVHTAPGHGTDDFNVCRNYKQLPIYVPVNFKGYMNEEAGKYNGLKTDEANIAILEDLSKSGSLLATEKIVHQYPHCWRCKHPILYRATEQWFCSIDGFKKEALAAVKGVKWIPGWGEIKIENMIVDRQDWCISRQRVWGVPIPAFYCDECGKYVINEFTISKISELFGNEGSDAWYKYTTEEMLGKKLVCEHCGCDKFNKDTDIMDVWFDSGTSYAYVLDKFENHRFPADLYLEGNDQYRGWFQSSLLTSIAARGVAPYKTVVTHGMVVDGEGKKMSKSIGNTIDPNQIIKEYGADVLRLWVSSVDYTGDVRISAEIMKQLSEIYRKIRNTARILLANLGTAETDFNPTTDMVEYSQLEELDRWALSRLNGLVGRVAQAYENYSFHLIYHDIHNFCTIDMSKLYIDIIKDRVYVEKKNAKVRRSAQTVIYNVLSALTRMIAPILPFTSDEIWQSMSHTVSDDLTNVGFNEMPVFNKLYSDEALEAKWNKLIDIREDVMKALESARVKKLIGKSLDAKVNIYGETGSEAMSTLEGAGDMLSTFFITSQSELIYSAPSGTDLTETKTGLKIEVTPADGDKCDRCWTYSTDTVKKDTAVICRRCEIIIK